MRRINIWSGNGDWCESLLYEFCLLVWCIACVFTVSYTAISIVTLLCLLFYNSLFERCMNTVPVQAFTETSN